jgi:hypothetical protein
MQIVKLDQHRSTHVVADRHWCCMFSNSTNFASIAGDLARYFGITATSLDDLASTWTLKRADLLIGAFHPTQSMLTVLGTGVTLDPITSKTLKAAVSLAAVRNVRRMMMVGWDFDVWTTACRQMRGAVPHVLYHGTSRSRLAAIRREGLRNDLSSNWRIGGRGNVYLTATPQTAAFHARRTAELKNSDPVVVACRKPRCLGVDWDVQNFLVKNPLVPSCNGRELSKEAGLFTSSRPIPPGSIIAAYEPKLSKPFSAWTIIYSAPRLRGTAGR